MQCADLSAFVREWVAARGRKSRSVLTARKNESMRRSFMLSVREGASMKGSNESMGGSNESMGDIFWKREGDRSWQ